MAAGNIVLGDRCFSSFCGIAPLNTRGANVVFRMHQRRRVDFHRGRCVGVLNYVVSWLKPARSIWIDRSAYDQFLTQVAVSEARILGEQAGFRVADLGLVTTLLDPAAFSKEHFADLYARRWVVEVSAAD